MTTEVITPQVDATHPLDGNAEYEAQMIAKADAGLGVGTQPEQKLLAGKYKSEEDLNKGILELIKKQAGGDLEAYYKGLEKDFHSTSANGGIKPEKSEQATAPENEGDNTDAGQEQQQEKTVDTSPIDFDRYGSEYNESGTLSESSITELTNKGIPREMVDQYLQGLTAVVELNKSHAFNLVGGEATYNEMISWARSNLSEGERDVFNKVIGTNDLTARGTAIANLYKQFKSANPTLLDGEGSGGPGDVYNSRAEMSADMKDPRYAKDPAFRETVMAKLARSKIM